MSKLDQSTISSPEYVYVFPPMIAGSILNAAAIPNFNGNTSKIVGLSRVLVGGVVGQPYASLGLGASLYPQIIVRSSNAADTSTYSMYWYNEVLASPSIPILGC